MSLESFDLDLSLGLIPGNTHKVIFYSFSQTLFRPLSVAKRSHPTSKVRGRTREDPMPEGRRPRGVTPRPRSGAVAESTRLRRSRNSREELSRVRDREGDESTYPVSEVRRRLGGVTHAQGQGWWPGGPTPCPWSPGCAGAGEPRGAIPC